MAALAPADASASHRHPQPQLTLPGQRGPEARRAGREHRVVHVGAQRGAHDDVHGVPDAHHVPGPVRGQARGAVGHHPPETVLVLRVPQRQGRRVPCPSPPAPTAKGKGALHAALSMVNHASPSPPLLPGPRWRTQASHAPSAHSEICRGGPCPSPPARLLRKGRRARLQAGGTQRVNAHEGSLPSQAPGARDRHAIQLSPSPNRF